MAGRSDSVYASKSSLLQWVGEQLHLKLFRLEQFASGALYCQLLDAYFANVVALHKVNFLARDEYEFLQNYKLLQSALNNLNIGRAIDVAKLSRASQAENLELLQWCYKFLKGKRMLDGYDPSERRAQSVKGGTDQVPLPSWLGNSFDVYGGRHGAGSPDEAGQTPNGARIQRAPSRTQSNRIVSTPPSNTPSRTNSRSNSLSGKTPLTPNSEDLSTPVRTVSMSAASRQQRRASTPSSLKRTTTTPMSNHSTTGSVSRSNSVSIPRTSSFRLNASGSTPNTPVRSTRSFSTADRVHRDAATQAKTTPASRRPSSSHQSTTSGANGVMGRRTQSIPRDPTPEPTPPPASAPEPDSPSAELMSPGARDGITEAVEVLGQAVNLLQRTVPNLDRLGPVLGTPNDSYAFRGKLRSLQDAISTLTQHCWRLLRDLQELGTRKGTDRHPGLQSPSLSPLYNRLKDCESSLNTSKADVSRAESTAGPPQPHPPRLADQHRELSSTKHLDAMLRTLGSAHAAMLQRSQREAASVTARFLDLAQPSSPNSSMSNGVDTGHEGTAPRSFATTKVLKLGDFQMKRLKNGDIYKGRYVNNRKNGEGVYSFINADVYEGEFKDDRMEGHGVYTFSHEGRYEGQWSHAVYEGCGAETFAKGSTYQGEYSLGLRDGYGACRFYSGDYYEGQWLKGLRHGRGMQQCTDDSNYVGDYQKGKRHGYGVYSFPNGDRYIGEYQEDIPHGHGVYLFATGQSYEGQWVKGRKHGWSIYTVETGERWAGQWVEGKPLWVQPLPADVDEKGLEAVMMAGEDAEDGSVNGERSSEVQSNLQLSWVACKAAQEAMKEAQVRADDHWKADGEIQPATRGALHRAAAAAEEAQRMRANARELAARLDSAAALVEDRGGKGTGTPTARTNSTPKAT